jgi:hypothetical protein
VSSSLVFGGCYHKALEAFYQARLEGRSISTRDELLAVFKSAWAEKEKTDVPLKFGKGEDVDSLAELAGRMLEAFLASVKPSQVVAIEEPVTFRIASDVPRIVGIVDLVEIRKDEDGVERLYLVDFKTAARKPKSGDVSQDQLIFYSLGLQKKGLLPQYPQPLALRYDITTKTKKPELIEERIRPERPEAERLIEKTRRCWQVMSQGVVWPAPSWKCNGCGYQDACRRWPEL